MPPDQLGIAGRHLFKRDVDNDSVEFVQANFAIEQTEVFSFDVELSTLIRPGADLGRVGFCEINKKKASVNG